MARSQAISRMRSTLLKRREGLRKSLAGELGLLKTLEGRSVGDEIDRALDAAQGEINSQLVEVESRELDQIEFALQLIESGQYGQCEECGSKIPLARLQAVPYATLCIACQREAERGNPLNMPRVDWGRITDSDTENNHVTFRDIESYVS